MPVVFQCVLHWSTLSPLVSTHVAQDYKILNPFCHISWKEASMKTKCWKFYDCRHCKLHWLCDFVCVCACVRAWLEGLEFTILCLRFKSFFILFNTDIQSTTCCLFINTSDSNALLPSSKTAVVQSNSSQLVYISV